MEARPRKTPIEGRPVAGFTLIEIVITILLVGIIAVVAVPNFIDFRDDAREAVTRDEMAALKRAIIGDSRVVSGGRYAMPGYEVDMGAVPTVLQDLVLNPGTGDTTQTYNPMTRRGWRGPYVDSASTSDYSKDAWGTSYTYNSGSRLIRSFGPDTVLGGGDDIDLNF